MDVIPPMNLAPEATPWGRHMQMLLTETVQGLERERQSSANAAAMSTSSNRVTTQNVQTLTALTGNLQQQVAGLAGAAINTTTVTASGAISAGSLSVLGDSAVGGAQHVAGDETVDGKLRNVTAYSNPITTSYRNLFVTSVDGQFGYNLSSRRFKQDIQTATVDPQSVLLLRLCTYRYVAAVEMSGDAAAIEHGLIAEEVEAAGLGWLVDYDEDGQPLTLKFHLIAMALLPVLQDLEERLGKVETALAGATS